MIQKILFILLSFFYFQPTYAQEIFDSLLTELNTKYPQEKIYIQTDKAFYNPGETVWLKAYLSLAQSLFKIG